MRERKVPNVGEALSGLSDVKTKLGLGSFGAYLDEKKKNQVEANVPERTSPDAGDLKNKKLSKAAIQRRLQRKTS